MNDVTPKPADQHRWLARLVGDWTYESGEGESHAEGTETVRMLGDLWMIAEGRGTMPGGHQAQALMTVGFDPADGRFKGEWVGSMMTAHWVYDGELSDDDRSLHLYCEGPAFDGTDRLIPYRDTHEIISDDERRLHGAMKGDDGQWSVFMTTVFRRKGAAK